MKYFDFEQFGNDFKSKLGYGDSLRSLSKQIGVSTATLSRVIKGKDITVNTLINICDEMCMDISIYIKIVRN